jgi:hypothetical protein
MSSSNFGKIYESTWWGSGAFNSVTGWGSIYKDLGTSKRAREFSDRVLADNGIVESINCINI